MNTGNMKYMVKFWKVAHPRVEPSELLPMPDVSNFEATSTSRTTKSKTTPNHEKIPPIRTPVPATMISIGASK